MGYLEECPFIVRERMDEERQAVAVLDLMLEEMPLVRSESGLLLPYRPTTDEILGRFLAEHREEFVRAVVEGGRRFEGESQIARLLGRMRDELNADDRKLIEHCTTAVRREMLEVFEEDSAFPQDYRFFVLLYASVRASLGL